MIVVPAAVMNLSHVVHEFSFGPYFPNLAQPLESSVETTPEREQSGYEARCGC